MKILVITNLFPPDFVGGYELGCADMVGALRERGHSVRVITSVATWTGAAPEPDTRRILNMSAIYRDAYLTAAGPEVAAHERLLGLGVDATNVGLLGQEIAAFEPDVAYLWNTLGLGAFGVVALVRQLGLPWVWHLMDQVPAHMCHFSSRPDQLGRRFATLFPGRYVCCSSHVAGEIASAGVELGEHVDLVPNWIAGERPPDRSACWEGSTLKLVSASGRLSEEKGTRILIETARHLVEHGRSGFSIDLYGRNHEPAYAALVRRHGLGDHVRLAGPVTHDELIHRLGSYDVFAFPTWTREPAAFAPLEAAGQGCVPLITDDCGNAEWLIDGVDCLKAPREAGAFAAVIGAILDARIDLPALSRRSQSAVWRRFSLAGCAAKVELILAAAAADAPTGRRASARECYTLARLAQDITQALLSDARP